ncbi:hypothetical protein [Mastigocoleus testarum]|nr:hypothetical protein [Mastigocoleus testarum]
MANATQYLELLWRRQIRSERSAAIGNGSVGSAAIVIASSRAKSG